MIHRIRELAASLQGDIDDLRTLTQQEIDQDDDEDPGLELLVKNAVRENWLEHDPRRVWKQLSERVRGPFGQVAVEVPALAGQPMPIAQHSAETDDQRPEVMRHRFFRLSDSVIPQR
jgi:hypothetical protein